MIVAVLADAVEGVIRAVIDAGDRCVFRFKPIAHPSRQIFVGAFVEIATTDTRLVGDDNDRSAQLVGPKAGQFENSRNEFELVQPMDVPTVNIDHAVAVQKKCTAMHGVPIYTIDGHSCLILAVYAAIGSKIAALLRGS